MSNSDRSRLDNRRLLANSGASTPPPPLTEPDPEPTPPSGAVGSAPESTRRPQRPAATKTQTRDDLPGRPVGNKRSLVAHQNRSRRRALDGGSAVTLSAEGLPEFSLTLAPPLTWVGWGWAEPASAPPGRLSGGRPASGEVDQASSGRLQGWQRPCGVAARFQFRLRRDPIRPTQSPQTPGLSKAATIDPVATGTRPPITGRPGLVGALATVGARPSQGGRGGPARTRPRASGWRWPPPSRGAGPVSARWRRHRPNLLQGYAGWRSAGSTARSPR